jgi:hypothetical protein
MNTAQRALQMLEQVLELAPAERGEFLDRHCGGDARLRAEVDA